MRYFAFGCSGTLRGGIEEGMRLKRMGVDFFELGHTPYVEMEEALQIRGVLRSCAIVPWSVHARYLDRECWPTLEGFEHDARIANTIGAQVMVTHSPGRLPDGSFDYERFFDAAQIAMKYDLIMAVETCHLGNAPYSTTSYRDLMEIVDHINMPNVGINVDTGHVHVGERRDVDTVIREIGPRLKTLHLHDNFGERDDHQAVGIGLIHWKEVVKALRGTLYQGPLMLELSGSHEERALWRQFSYDNSMQQEIVYSRAWLKWLWDELDQELLQGSLTNAVCGDCQQQT